MKKISLVKKLILFTSFTLFASLSYGNIIYEDWFTSQEMRVDLTHSGDANSEYYFVEYFKIQNEWAGRRTYLVDTSGYGDNFFEVYDSLSNKLIFSKGYNNLFYEWQATEEAKHTNRSFEEVIRFPFPKKTVLIKMFKRLNNGKLKQLHQFYANPNSYRVTRGKSFNFKTERLHGKKDPCKAVDIAILAEGYTLEQMDKFKEDAEKMTEFLFNTRPFNTVKKDFNIWLVYSESNESGTDIFGESVFKNTILNTHFYTFNSERYLTTQSIKRIHDLASLVPYDQVYILVNSAKYGGGGIYNYYNLTSTDHAMSPWVFIHELGHGFAALADEYFDSSTAYNDLYDLSTEPWRPNITTMVEPEKKWKHMVDKKTPVPTPATSRYEETVGFYEGGGYVEKGVYRPYQECEMKTLNKGFCPVCQEAILQMVEWSIDK